MLLKLTKIEVGYLRQALYRAIDFAETDIDAHECEWSKRKNIAGGRNRIVPREYRSMVEKERRSVVAYKKMLRRLSEGEPQKGGE